MYLVVLIQTDALRLTWLEMKDCTNHYVIRILLYLRVQYEISLLPL